MNFKKIILLGLFLFLLLPISNVSAFTHVDNVKNGNYIFFLVDLKENETVEIGLTHEESGNFTLFLFNRRPSESYVKDDNSLKEKIFNDPPTVDHSLDDSPYINYTTTIPKIYYVEIILVSGGPDTYTLTCNKDLTRYYLPLIPGYQLEVLIFAFILSLGIIFIFYKKRINK